MEAKSEQKKDSERFEALRSYSTWGWNQVCREKLCCRPPVDARPIDLLRAQNPVLANRIYQLELFIPGTDKERWRLKLDGIATYGTIATRYKAQGTRMKAIGNISNFLLALFSLLTPLLIGMQGSLGEDECATRLVPGTNGTETVRRNWYCFTREEIDKRIKYTLIAISLFNSLLCTHFEATPAAPLPTSTALGPCQYTCAQPRCARTTLNQRCTTLETLQTPSCKCTISARAASSGARSRTACGMRSRTISPSRKDTETIDMAPAQG